MQKQYSCIHTSFVFLFVLFFSKLNAQNINEKYIRIVSKNKTEVKTIGEYLFIRNVAGDTVFAFANSLQLKIMDKFGIAYTEIANTESIAENSYKVAPSLEKLFDWVYYPSYGQYVEFLNKFATDYPQLCKLVSIGKTVNGRDLFFVKISDNVNEKEAEPEVMYSSSMHGDELTGYILMLRLIHHLLTNYQTDAKIAKLVDNLEIWINPLANPDGTYGSNNDSICYRHRENANYVDLNRDFPDPTKGKTNTTQAETKAMVNFISEHNFTISANFHCGAEVVNYPWDSWTSAYPDYRSHPDNSWFVSISRAYVDTVKKYSTALSGYFTWPYTLGITEGADWYYLYGGRQDFVTYYRHGREITVELSNDFTPPSARLPLYWEANRNSLLNYMEEALYGIKGIVTDSITGNPVYAKVEILNHDKDSSEVYTDKTFGNYQRMLASGTYSVKYSAKGYVSKTLTGISVAWHKIIEKNVVLIPETALVKLIGWDAPILDKNPFRNEAKIDIYCTTNQVCKIYVYDVLGRKVDYQIVKLSEGKNEISMDSQKWQSGMFLIQLNIQGKDKILKGIKQ